MYYLLFDRLMGLWIINEFLKTYLMINHTKTNASFVSALPKSICDKLAAKR